VNIRDNGCSLKAYRRGTLDRMDLYSDMHRFLPALAAATGGARITELPVRHHARRFGHSKYGLSRVLKILADLLTISMIMWFRERPLTLFGLGALASFGVAVGFFVASGLALSELAEGIADTYVLPASGMLFALLGCYLLMLGLVAQVYLHRSRERQPIPPPIAVERSA
jgi:dolichol-phosphate mannosyltransferase